jgi:hypothetical protein
MCGVLLVLFAYTTTLRVIGKFGERGKEDSLLPHCLMERVAVCFVSCCFDSVCTVQVYVGLARVALIYNHTGVVLC